MNIWIVKFKGAPLISMMFRQIDTNKNGKLDFNEALRVFELLGKAGHLGQGGSGGGFF